MMALMMGETMVVKTNAKWVELSDTLMVVMKVW
jgi:hypothetical protein